MKLNYFNILSKYSQGAACFIKIIQLGLLQEAQ